MSDIDDKLAAAWRDASREEPPAALDTALRAAARRAVHAGPARARHMQTWPLAAAAVVAVLAVGILQLTPPEDVTPGMIADSTMRKAPAQKPDAAAPAAPAATMSEPAMPVVPSTPAPMPPDKSRRAATPPPMRDLATASRQVAQAPTAPAGAALDRLKENPEVAAETDLAKKKLRARSDADQPMESKLAADARESAAAPAPRAEPFPAAGVGASLAGGDAASGARAQVGALSAVAPPPPAAQSAPTANEPGKPQVAPANAMRTEESQARLSAETAMAKTAATPARVKDEAIKPPEEWIKLIRRLKSEGRNDEAAKELAAFRAAYKERADSLLPADLREARR